MLISAAAAALRSSSLMDENPMRSSMLRTIRMDIDELRDAGIRLHGLTKADSVYTFYHDETEYIRRLHIVDDGRLNAAELKGLPWAVLCMRASRVP
ncbi:hypothetical protein [Bradyrhizobium sp. BRP56]|uniref:hypothetical protein n=1 Tax=Bradyrhizobium sp. BRP56 TaxID=2793819 RepID=UPI001CD4A776|nr:hypothetical protein [Bradyrhizobium sp. BRP56]